MKSEVEENKDIYWSHNPKVIAMSFTPIDPTDTCPKVIYLKYGQCFDVSETGLRKTMPISKKECDKCGCDKELLNNLNIKLNEDLLIARAHIKELMNVITTSAMALSKHDTWWREEVAKIDKDKST